MPSTPCAKVPSSSTAPSKNVGGVSSATSSNEALEAKPAPLRLQTVANARPGGSSARGTWNCVAHPTRIHGRRLLSPGRLPTANEKPEMLLSGSSKPCQWTEAFDTDCSDATFTYAGPAVSHCLAAPTPRQTEPRMGGLLSRVTPSERVVHSDNLTAEGRPHAIQLQPLQRGTVRLDPHGATVLEAAPSACDVTRRAHEVQQRRSVPVQLRHEPCMWGLSTDAHAVRAHASACNTVRVDGAHDGTVARVVREAAVGRGR
eukprot:2574800-Prymnesium_polylepis.1